MIKKTAVFLAVGLLAVLFVFPGITGAQEKKSQLYFIGEMAVKPGGVARFEAAIKKEIELAYPLPWAAYSTDDFFYYFLFPIENWGGIDAINKADTEWMAKIGGKFQELMKSLEGTVDYYRCGAIRHLPDLSYAPKAPRLKPEEQNFLVWYFAYIEFGKEIELAGLLKQWIELGTSKNIPDGWEVYLVESGAEMPLYFWVENGKSAADYYVENEKVVKEIGEGKFADLWGKTAALLRKYEIKTGRPRPDLSNMPKK